MELVGITHHCADRGNGKVSGGQELFGLLDADAGQIFERCFAGIAAEQTGEVRRVEAQRGGQHADIDLLHVVFMHVPDRAAHAFLRTFTGVFLLGKLETFQKLRTTSAQHGVQILTADGLEQIVKSPVAKCLLGIFKVGVAGEQHSQDIRIARRDGARELQSVHHRHADVRDDQLNVVFIQKLERFRTVFCLGAHHEIFPLQFLKTALQRLAQIKLIVCEENMKMINLTHASSLRSLQRPLHRGGYPYQR